MSTLPVRYTNNHHVASSKTASPIVVAVNKAAVAGCVSAAYHRHQQHQQQRHHHTPPVKRHPTKMAAARRAKSKSRSRMSCPGSGSAASASSPAKRRNGKAGKKLPPQVMCNQAQQHQQEPQSTEQGLTAQHMVLDVSAGNGGLDCAVAATQLDTVLGVNGGGDNGLAEWTTQVGGDAALRTPDAASATSDRLSAAIEEQHNNKVTDNEKGIGELQHQQDDQLMDTSETMDDDEVASTSSQSGVAVSVATMTMDADAMIAPMIMPRRSNEELFVELQEALALEPKYQPIMYLPHSSKVGSGDTTINGKYNRLTNIYLFLLISGRRDNNRSQRWSCTCAALFKGVV